MSVEKKNEVRTVTWLLVAKNLIKFVGDDNSYPLAENVIAKSNFAKFPILKGDSVEVDIKEGKVVYLRKVKADAPKQEAVTTETVQPNPEPVKQEVKKEAPPIQVAGEWKELTVYAVTTDKKVVKFTEIKDEGWKQIDPTIQALDYKEVGLIAKNRVKVQIVENNVVAVQKVASQAPQTPVAAPTASDNVKKDATPVQAPVQASSPKKEWKPASQYNDDRQNSIECQAMINSACEVVGQVAASVSPAPTASVINNMIKAIAESNYQLLQDLKKKS